MEKVEETIEPNNRLVKTILKEIEEENEENSTKKKQDKPTGMVLVF